MSFEPTDQERAEDEEASTAVSPGEWIRFVLGAARRHWLLGVTSAIVLTALGIAVSLAIPPMFEVTTKILVGQNALITSALSNPNRQVPTVDPMRGISDITMTRENLEAIIRETGLIEHWAATRSSVLKLKDWAWSKVAGPIPESERMRALVGVLETRLSIKPDDTTAIIVQVMWGDREMAVKIVKIARDKFLQAREGQETSVITAAIGVLDDELKRVGDAIEPALAAVVQAREKVREPAARTDAGAAGPTEATPPSAYVRTAPTRQGPDATVSAKLTELRTAYRNAQEPWQRRLTELRLQLSELRSQYGAAHPLVVQQEAKIKDATLEPQELSALREEERALLSRIESGALAAGDGSGARLSLPRGAAAAGSGLAAGPLVLEEAPEVSAARAKLMSAVSKYDELKNRLDAARIELTTTEIAFKYRYVIVAEPELPRKPIKPNRPALIVASIAAGLLGGFLAGALRELSSGRVVEAWQVKQIGLPLLADVSLSDRPDR